MPASRRLILNAQGILSNPNIALAAARAGTLDQLTHGPTARIDQRALAEAQRSGLSAIIVTLGYVAGPSDPRTLTLSELEDWDAFITEHPAHLFKVLSVRRVLIDLSHSSDRSCADVLHQSNASVAITHTGRRAVAWRASTACRSCGSAVSQWRMTCPA